MKNYWKTKLRLEKIAYDKGINAALYQVENSDTYIEFKDKVEKALYSQIKEVATKKNIDNLLLFTKADSLLSVAVTSYLTPLKEKINLAAFLYKVGSAGGQSGIDKLGINGKFVLKNPELIAYFDDYSNLIINSVDGYTKEWLASKIQSGKDKFLNPSEIVNTILDDGKGISKLRAERIVLTESAKAMITVELEVARRYGIKEKIWRTSYDERTCPICLALEGTKTGVSVNFNVDAGILVQGPPAHVSCRCFLEEVVPNDWDIPSNLWLGD